MLTSIRRSTIAAIHDICMAALSFILSLYLRLGDNITIAYEYVFIGTVLFTAVCFMVFTSMRLYQGIWRYASVPDLIAIVKSVTLAILIFLPLLFVVTRLEGFPRSSLFINWLVLIVLLGGPRILYRIVKDKRVQIDFNSSALDKRIPVLLAGIDANAELFIRETLQKDGSEYRIVGIVSPDTRDVGRHVHGMRVVGTYDQLHNSIKSLQARGLSPRKIVLSDSSPSSELVQQFLDIAYETGLTLARLPKRSELRQAENNQSQTSNIRPIVIEDLLGRSQAALDRDGLASLIVGKIVLVTGAGGTIGGELVRQIAKYTPSQIILFDVSEYNLYRIDQELASLMPDLPRHTLIGDVSDAHTMEHIFSRYQPQLVFHAAAIKHVPIAEDNRVEAIKTNALGTRIVADCCHAHHVEAMVLISTDKAVNPTSIMGATKRLAERYCHSLGSLDDTRTHFITVRFGNVLGSSGSVIPLFERQIAKGGPITITHPDIERFFMTVREAVELVLQAALQGLHTQSHSDIFVLNMGQPVKIVDLAQQMIRMSGLRPSLDIAIEFTGLRPGEKLYEELFYDNEMSQDTENSDILLVSSPVFDYDSLCDDFNQLAEACTRYDSAMIATLITKLVPQNQLSLDE